MAKPRIVILSYHGKGHLNPCFPLAEILAPDYDVVFVGVGFFEAYVRESGFSYYPLNTVPFGMGMEWWVNRMRRRMSRYLHTLRDRWNDRLYTERTQELTTMLDRLQPTLVLLDDRQSSDFLVLYPHLQARGIRFGILHAMPPAALIPGVPPVNTTVFPDDTAGIRRAHGKVKRQRLKRLWKQKLLYLGMDDSSILHRRVRRNNIPRHFFSGRTIFYGLGLQNVHELILLPQELNFPGIPTSPFQHYIGSLHRSTASTEAKPNYLQARERVQQKIDAGWTCIYCSIGTVESNDTRETEEFMDRLVAAVQDKRIVLILSVGLLAIRTVVKYLTKADHIFVFHSVPQLDVLRYAKLFVTHGGINSIKESVDAGVPMLVYPVDSIMDPPGNAVRVVYHGLGLRGDMAHDTVADISHNIQTVLTDNQYRDNVQRMRETCRAYTPEGFLQAIRQCTVPV